ncbi:hypothetical protein [Mesorhizobium amorphae]|uniref:hypothetical protein n=1 Tax=Mesorhizobium amorphae TaxID=71433 RepID=UPI001183177C|nr:hypothetical protein [Mesorhizobium amorphae]
MKQQASQTAFPDTRIEITAGTVQSETVTDENGTRDVLTNLGARRYFVDIIEGNGSRASIWDGDSRRAALAQAQILSPDFGEVRDLTGEAA